MQCLMKILQKFKKAELKIYLFLVTVMLSIIIAMIYIYIENEDIRKRYSPLVEATEEIQLQSALAHLWFEELITGDTSISINQVYEYLELAQWNINAMLTGGTNKDISIIAIENTELQNEIIQIKTELNNYKIITKKRWENKKYSKIGSETDSKYDKIFNSFQYHTLEVKNQIKSYIENKHHNFHKIQLLLILISLLLFIITLIIIYNYIIFQKKAQLALQNEKIQLKKANKEYYNLSEEYKAQNKKLKKAKEKVENKEKNFRDIFNNTTDAIYIQDKNSIFIEVNNGATNMYGYPRDFFIGKNPNFLSAPGKNNLKEIKELVKDAFNGKAHQYEFWGIRKNGQIFPKIVRTQSGIYDGKKVVVTFSLDISDRVKIEEKLRLAKEKAEENDHLKTEFINNMSHEIRTPMNGIIGFAQFLNNPDLSREKQKYYISIIQNSGNQLMRIIDDILEISMLGTKQVKTIESKICLNNLFLELFSIFDIKAKENKTPLYFKKGLSDKESTIFVDESKLNKILSNLLENALKFTNIGFIEFGYNLIETNHNAEIQIYVKDTGIGINPEKQAIIFERFTQEEEISQNVGGLGLGLSIAKENAELIGGKITLESEKEKGSTFFITIPYKQN